MSRRFLTATALAYLIGFAAAAPSSALATHSIRTPPRWWDQDNDGVVDASDGNVVFFKAGTGWGPDGQGNDWGARLDEALGVWRNGTDYDPVSGSPTVNVIYVNGQVANGGSFSPGPVAITHTYKINRGTYEDIYDTDISFNTNAFLFWTQPGTPSVGCSSLGCYSGRGVLVHELGHTAGLKDLYDANCPPGPTMCGTADTTTDSDRLFSLTTDDINAADSLY